MGKELQPLLLTHPIILFDGVCNLCNGSVNTVLRFDRKKLFRYVMLQSELGEKLKNYFHINPEVDSVIVIFRDKCYYESDAVLLVLTKLGFPWNLFNAFSIVPARIRNAAYRWVAKNRYRLFGVKDSCRIPNENEREYFPDDLEL